LPAIALHQQKNFAAAMVGLGSGFRFRRQKQLYASAKKAHRQSEKNRKQKQ